MNILYFLESIRNPFLDAVMSVLTYLGSEIGFLAFAIAFFWCVDKNRGYYIMSVGFLGVIISQFLKIICMVPRPWIKDPNFTIVESARADAEGYSFPSGHTQNAACTYGSILRFSKKNIVRILCATAIVIVAVSRMYLGVHTPLDVGVGLAIGAVLVLVLYPVFEHISKNEKYMYAFFAVFFVISVLFTLFAFLWKFPSDIDEVNLYSLRKNACTLLGATGGVLVIFPIESKYIKFDTKATVAGQAVKLVLGLGSVLAIKEGLKKLFVLIGNGTEYFPLRSLRYFLIVVFAMGVFPLLFKYFANIGRKRTDVAKTSVEG